MRANGPDVARLTLEAGPDPAVVPCPEGTGSAAESDAEGAAKYGEDAGEEVPTTRSDGRRT